MGKARKGKTPRKQTKVAGRKKKQVKENAAALNEPINFRERMGVFHLQKNSEIFYWEFPFRKSAFHLLQVPF